MKKLVSLLLAVLMLCSLVACSKGGEGGGNQTAGGTYDITVWVSEVAGIAELTKQQIDRFNEENADLTFNATIEGISEADAATLMITDVESGADLYCFAQDQTARLVQAGALAVLGQNASEAVKARDDAGSVMAATFGDSLYAYPMTSDNGFFMYYDKSVISEDMIDDLATLVKACEDNNKFFSMNYSCAWYNSAWFFGTGCVSQWITDDTGAFTGVVDTYNSPEGMAALKGMQILAKSNAKNDSGSGEDFSKGSAVVVSGTWDVNTVQSILGDNMGVADLPSFTVDGNTYHMGSFSGGKLMGVKPQTDPEKAAALQRLALYLTDEACQLERFNSNGWGPSNVAAKASDDVQSNPVLAALGAQNNYATVQGQVNDGWWAKAGDLGHLAAQAESDEELQAGLALYEEQVKGLIGATGYVFVGAWNGWDNADLEGFGMEQDGNVLTITLDVPESDYMGGRIVPVTSWDTNLGCQQVTEGADLIVEYDEASNGDNNIIFLAPGNYTVTCDVSTSEIKIVKN